MIAYHNNCMNYVYGDCSFPMKTLFRKSFLPSCYPLLTLDQYLNQIVLIIASIEPYTNPCSTIL